MPESNIGIQSVMRHRAVQSAFPKVEANIAKRTDISSPAVIELSVLTSSKPKDSIANASAFCEMACIYNPNTKNPEVLAYRESEKIDIECTGITPTGRASLSIPETGSISDVVALAPCGVQLETTGVPTILLGRMPDTGEKPEIRNYPWYDPFGRFVERVISDYTRNPDLLTANDVNAINDNTAKHVRSLRVAALSLASIGAGLTLAQSDALNLLALTGSFGSMAAFGSAWFGISFGNIRREFFDAAVKTTENMLKPLEISMAATYAALAAGTINTAIERAPLAIPLILAPFGYAFLAGTKAIIQYDTSDLFSAGLNSEHLDYLRRENQLLRSIGIEADLAPEVIRERLTTWRDTLGTSRPALS